MATSGEGNAIINYTIHTNVLAKKNKNTNHKKMSKLQERRYTLSELSAILREERERNEFNPVVFNKENKKENKDAVDSILKDAEKPYGGKLKIERKISDNGNPDLNKTTLDAKFSVEPGKEWIERTEAQAEGYDSSLQKENHNGKESEDEKATHESGKKFYEKRKEISKDMNKKGEATVKAGLKAREIAKDIPDAYKAKTAFGENRVSKRLRFKNTVFLSEERIRSLIPEEYKTNGNKFYMTDASDTDYLVECKHDDVFGYVTINIHKCEKEEEINEELDRMKSLFSYKSSDYNRPNRTDTLRNDIKKVKDLEKGE